MRFIPAVFASILSLAMSAPAQAQDPASTDRVLIFFAWDRPVIDSDAAAQLEALVAAVRASPGVMLEIGGHADRSGPSASNLRAGRVRSGAVRDFLVARGVPQTAMTIVSYGEERPLIATADGVREPQNRRVEIIVRRSAGA